MWVETVKKKDKDGKDVITGYKYVKRYFNQKLGKNRTVSKTLKANSAQARNKADVILNKMIAEINSTHTKDKKSFGEVYDAYYKVKSPHWEASTEQTTRSLYTNHIENDPVNNFLIDKITTSDVRKVIDKMQFENNMSESMTRKAYILIRAVTSFAKEEFSIDNKINFKLVVVKKQIKKNTLDYIDSSILKGEIEKMHALIGGRYALFLEAQILTGMRFGELAAITEADWDGHNIDINKAVKTANKRKVGGTKNFSSMRIIQSNARLNEIFSLLINENKMLFNDKASLIFANQKNKPQLNYYLNDKLKLVNKEYTTHTLRHTHISLLAEKGLPLKYIMDRVGHSKPETTLKIYTHVTEKMLKKGQQALDDLF